jgi:hypothetical protein
LKSRPKVRRATKLRRSSAWGGERVGRRRERAVRHRDPGGAAWHWRRPHLSPESKGLVAWHTPRFPRGR